MRSSPPRQLRLWPYSFDVIPVELISSIYEMFAHSNDPLAAEAGSVHYTRLGLVELVLGLSMQGMKHTSRVLDPSCGSGVFLVEASRRLVWLREREMGRRLDRYELREMLCSQIYGIDIDRDAVQVAAFSLYLTLLELDPDPQPPDALRFPPLVTPERASESVLNLTTQDFFNTAHPFDSRPPFVDRGFDLVVGNAPWTALNDRTAPRDPDDSEHGRQWGLEYCRRKTVPDCKPDQGFLLRVRDFVNPTTMIGMVIGSRLFYQESDKGHRWLRTFLHENTVSSVVNLSDLVSEDMLFSGESSTRLPASVLLFSVSHPSDDNVVLYVTPK